MVPMLLTLVMTISRLTCIRIISQVPTEWGLFSELGEEMVASLYVIGSLFEDSLQSSMRIHSELASLGKFTDDQLRQQPLLFYYFYIQPLAHEDSSEFVCGPL